MLRVSAAAALTLAGLVAPLPLLAGIRVEERKAAIAPNALGTWRLDSLLDQAVVNGMQPGEVDPATYVLHDLRFDDASVEIVPMATPFGEGKVSRIDGATRLEAKGRAALFKIKVPRTKSADVGAIAWRVRSKESSEVAILREQGLSQLIQQMLGGMGGMGGMPNLAGLQFGPGGAGGPPMPPFGGPMGGGPGGGRQLDPRQSIGDDVTKFEADGEWHTVARARPAVNRQNAFGGGQPEGQRNAAIEELTLAVLVPADQKEKPDARATLDLEFVHLIDSKADYAKATVAPCQVDRRSVLHQGLHLNTPASVTWRLVAPEGAKLLAGLSALNDRPFDLFVHVQSAAKGRETLFHHAYEPAPPADDPEQPVDIDSVVPVKVDLAAYAGQEIAVEVEVVEQEEPNVAFLLQPLIHGKRTADGPRNVMLYFCDTLRADALSSYGNTRATTPTLDALAASGIRFERCFSQGAWTYVSMPSSLSSLFPSVNGVRSGGERIPGSATTVAEAFRSAGYLTAAFIRNDFVGPTTHTEQGFDFFFPGNVIGPVGGADPAAVQQFVAQNALNDAVAKMFGNRGPQNADAGAGAMNFGSGSSRDLYAKVEPWLDQYRDVPFFLYMHAVDPHDPYEPDKLDRAKFLSQEEDEAFKAMETKFNDWQLAQQAAANAAGGNLVMGPGGVLMQIGGAVAPVAPPAAPAAAAAPADGAAVANGGDKAAPVATETAAPDGAAPVAPPPAAGAPPANPPVRVRGPGLNPGAAMREMYASAGIDVDDFMRKQRAIYDAEVHYFDRHYRQLRDYFAKHDLTQRTVFSFNADHGEEFLDHGATGHGQSVYAELNHVPWILSAAGLLPEGKVVADNVANVDLGPTLLGLAGVTPPDTMQGRNLAAELQAGDDLPAMMIVTERWGGGMFGGAGPTAGGEGEYLGEWAVMEGRWKTIVRRSMEPKMGADGKPGAPELTIDLEIYDLHADMTDAKSLIESERPRAEATAKRLEIWLGEMRKLAASYAGDDTTSDGALDMMRALGYAQ